MNNILDAGNVYQLKISSPLTLWMSSSCSNKNYDPKMRISESNNLVLFLEQEIFSCKEINLNYISLHILVEHNDIFEIGWLIFYFEDNNTQFLNNIFLPLC